MNELLSNLKPTAFSDLADINAAGLDSGWVNLENYGRVTFVLICKTQGGTPAVTMQHATSNGGAGTPAAFPIREYWRITNTAAATASDRDAAVRAAVTGNTFNLTAGNAQVYLVDADAQDLPEGRTHVRFRVADPAAAAVVGLVALAYKPREAGRSMPTALD